MKLTKTLLTCFLLGSVAACSMHSSVGNDPLNSCKSLRKQGKSPKALSCFYNFYQNTPVSSASHSEALVGMGWSFYGLWDVIKDHAINPAYAEPAKVCLGTKSVPTGDAVASSIGLACVNQVSDKNIAPFWNSMKLVVEMQNQEDLGKNDESLLTLQKAIQVDPNNEVAYSNLAWVYGHQSKWAEAIKASKKAIKLDPKNVMAYDVLVWSYGHQNKLAEAIKASKKAIELDQENVWAYNNLAWAYYKQKNYALALENAKKLIEINSRNLDYLDTLIQIDYALFQEEKDPTLKKQYQKDFKFYLEKASQLEGYQDQKSLYYYRCVAGDQSVCKAALVYLKNPLDAHSAPNDLETTIAELEKMVGKQ